MVIITSVLALSGLACFVSAHFSASNKASKAASDFEMNEYARGSNY